MALHLLPPHIRGFCCFSFKSLTRFLISFNLAPCSFLQYTVWWVSNIKSAEKKEYNRCPPEISSQCTGGYDLDPAYLPLPWCLGRLDPSSEGGHHSHCCTGGLIFLERHHTPLPQGAATAMSSVSLGLGLHNLESFSSNHLLVLLAFVLGTAAIGGLAAGGLTLLIQVLVQPISTSSKLVTHLDL